MRNARAKVRPKCLAMRQSQARGCSMNCESRLRFAGGDAHRNGSVCVRCVRSIAHARRMAAFARGPSLDSRCPTAITASYPQGCAQPSFIRSYPYSLMPTHANMHAKSDSTSRPLQRKTMKPWPSIGRRCGANDHVQCGDDW